MGEVPAVPGRRDEVVPDLDFERDGTDFHRVRHPLRKRE